MKNLKTISKAVVLTALVATQANAVDWKFWNWQWKDKVVDRVVTEGAYFSKNADVEYLEETDAYLEETEVQQEDDFIEQWVALCEDLVRSIKKAGRCADLFNLQEQRALAEKVFSEEKLSKDKLLECYHKTVNMRYFMFFLRHRHLLSEENRKINLKIDKLIKAYRLKLQETYKKNGFGGDIYRDYASSRYYDKGLRSDYVVCKDGTVLILE